MPFRYEAGPEGKMTAWGGLPVIVEFLRSMGVGTQAAALDVRQRDSGFEPFQMLTAFVLLMTAGGDCLDDIEMLRQDPALVALLGHDLPSAETLRRYLEAFHDPQLMAGRAEHEGKAWIAPESTLLQRLGALIVELVHAVARSEPVAVTQATLDHDASVIEAHKKEARAHFKGGRGYQPATVVWAEMGMTLVDEFRDGNVPAGMANRPLIERAFAALPETVSERFFRADSACYDVDVLKWLAQPQRRIGFAISADMSRELRSACTALDANAWTLHEQRGQVTIDRAEVEFTPGDWPKQAAPLRYLALRFVQPQGCLFADGSTTRYFAIVTNRQGDAGEIIDWHRQKAGTIELVHDITKNDLGAGVLPSGKFGANAAWYRFVLLTHNVLVAMKRLVLPPALNKARPKRLRLRVFALATHVTSHARGIVARVARWALEIADLIGVRARIDALAPS